MSNSSPFFRASVAAVIVNSRGLVLAFERKKEKGAWQFPQGGLDEGEKLRTAVERELKEETGIIAEKDLDYLGKHREWLAYQLPKAWRSERTGRGQTQKWFCYRVKDDELKIDLEKAEDDEFSAFRWIEMDELVRMVVKFRSPAYKRLRKWLRKEDLII